MKVYKKYIAAISFGLLMGATAYGARNSYDSALKKLDQEAYEAAKTHIASLPADTDLDAPGALGQYPSRERPLVADRPPLHACVWLSSPQTGILKALLETRRVKVDIMHDGVTPLYEALSMKFFEPRDLYTYKAAQMLLDFGASLFMPCAAQVTDRFKNEAGKPLMYVAPYFGDYRFGDGRPTSTPFELALQSFMHITCTRLEDSEYSVMPHVYAKCAEVLRDILQTGLGGCALEHIDGDDSPLREYKIQWHNADMHPHGYAICYKIIQKPGDLPALAITKKAYNLIMALSPVVPA